MTERIRTGLGLLAVALIALIVGVAAEGDVSTLALVAAGWLAVFGLGTIAYDLLRPASRA